MEGKKKEKWRERKHGDVTDPGTKTVPDFE
jgi:hypothetical protein